MVKIKSMESNACSQNHLNNLLISATAGTIIGATTALLFAPKSGRRLRDDIYRTYEDLSEKGQDLMDDVVERGQKAADTASDYAEDIKNSASNLFGSTTQDNSNTNLLIGAIGGGVLGLAAVLFLLQSRNQENGDEGLLNKINKAGKLAKKNSAHWVETARDLLETISSKVSEPLQHNGSVSHEDESEDSHSTLHNVMDLASVGFKVWQNMKKRR
jgi:gas vesicle protein